MSNELSVKETNEIKNTSVENFKNIKPDKEMTSKEVSDFWKNEFAKEKALADMTDKDNTAEVSKIDISDSDISDKEASNKDISEVVNDYIEDLKAKSEYADTILENALDSTKLELQTPEKVKEKKEEFDDIKAKLRKEWEKINHQEWPKYKEDVKNADGVVIRKAGDNYDAHHIQPVQLGGENVASNITPLDVYSHRDIHSGNGSCTALVKNVKGEKNL